jgi:hypothetical protein
MKKFLIRLLIYLIPLPVYLAVIALVDPFDYIGKNNFISEDVKTEISEKLNPYLWKLIEYKHNQSPRIILGDSRAAKIREYHIKEKTGLDYYNLAFPGGTLADMIETFWYADSRVELREVYMGISFNLYNDFEQKNNVKQAKSIMKNFFSYAFSKIVFTSAFKDIQKQFLQKNVTVGVPDMNAEDFWKYEIEIIGKRFYQKYRYPQNYHDELEKISEYCKNKKIKLVFFMPPNHVEWQKRVSDFNLENQRRTFIQDITELGPLFNLDEENDFTVNRRNFLDPVHPVNDSLLVSTLWGRK